MKDCAEPLSTNWYLFQAVQLTFVGYVKDHSDSPVAGAVVSFDDSLGAVSTNAIGRFIRLLSVGKHWVYIDAKGYKTLVMVRFSNRFHL